MPELNVSPTLDVSELNVTIAVIGAFMVAQGLSSVLIKSRWFLGEALPAMVLGIALGPLAANFLNNTRWGLGSLSDQQQSAITLGFMRVLIGTQLFIAGYQLPAKYCFKNWRDMFIVLIPIMTIMWLCTTACLVATIPKISLLACLAIGACVTSTDPVLSQAIAKGDFAEKYVARPLREIISAEAGANDGFGFPFLMLATYLIQRIEAPHKYGLGVVVEHWGVETWLYVIVMSVPYGAAVGFGAGKAIKYCLRRKWIDAESYLLFPSALALFTVGTCGCIGTDDLLASFCAGAAMNWDGEYLAETEQRQDEVNSSIDTLLNLTGFMYVGVIMPWDTFHDPTGTGITLPRLFALGFLVLIFRRIPALLLMYKAMPGSIKNWREAIFMGYFGPIGVGAVFYVEHAKPLFPHAGDGNDVDDNLVRAIVPCVYFLVLFSIIVHGLSIPLLNIIYSHCNVQPVKDDAVQIRRMSMAIPTPVNAKADADGEYFVAYNRFSRPEEGHRRTVTLAGHILPLVREESIGRPITTPMRRSYDFDALNEEKVRAQLRAYSLAALS